MQASLAKRNGAARRPRALLQSVAGFFARESLPIVVASVLAILTAVLLPELFSSDGWLALVGGRFIAHHGLPHHDTLTILGRGHEWIDQQWLGQLAFYGLAVAGGVRLVLVANVGLVIGAFVGAMVYARQRGGRPTTVAVVAFVALLPFVATAVFARTQSLAYVPFVALVILLSRDRLSTRAVVLILCLLAVWSNVHGSVLLAVPLVALRGILELRRSRWLDRRAAALVLLPWLCVFASPYTFQLMSYYDKTAFNPSFSKYLSYWAPTTFSPISAPLLVLLFTLLWLLGRSSETYSTYERWLLVVAAVIGLLAVRNWAFAALLVVMLAPVGVDRVLSRGESRPAPWIAAGIASVVAVATVIGVVAAFTRSGPALTRDFSRGASTAVYRAATSPRARIYAGVKFSNWLMWEHPGLQGKLVLDARYELLTAADVKRLVLFSAGSGVDVPLGNPTVYVLDPATDDHAIAALRPHVHVLYDTDHVFVADVQHT
jgi:hypothetical protein